MKEYIGLTELEVNKNQSIYGLNVLHEVKKPNFFILFLNEFKDWLVIILIIAALLSFIVDPHSLIESIIILFILFLNATIGVVQEIKAFKSLDSLKKLTEHKSKVIREGKISIISSSLLTVDDLVVLEKGNVVDADILLIEANDLKIDEAVLTGESIPIEKNVGDMINSATFIVSGYAKGIVKKIGMNTKMGEIAKTLIDSNQEITPLEIKLNQIGKIIGLIAIIICLCVFFLELALKISIIEAFKSAISLAVAAIPEGLATVVTVCLAIGVGRMAKQNVIIKRLEAVETLGCSNIVCTDKTGTLTLNKEKIVAIYDENRLLDINNLDKISDRLLNYLFMSSNPNMEEEISDPIDKAILTLFKTLDKTKPNFKIINHTPFNSENKYSNVNVAYQNSEILIFKGAYDILVDLVKNKPKNEIDIIINNMMEKGYRVIAIATELKIIGLIAMQDLPKENTYKTIESAKEAGLKTIMITGDHIKTAFSIGKDLGIAETIDETITKKELDNLNDEQLVKNIDKYKIYARVNPKDKVRIIKAWQKRGMIVAMTGDGINDAPALKTADIGCAMGSGTDVAKDASDVIIVDSNYNSIIKGIKNGRIIYENIKNCCKYLLASNIGEVLTILLITLLSLILKVNLGIPLASIQLLWINVITDSLPAFGLGLIKGNDDLMKKPPRKTEEGFFSNGIGIEILFIGIVIGLLTIISYLIGLKLDSSYASTMAFVTISMSQLLHSYNCVSDKTIFNKNILKNKILNYSFIIGTLLILVVIYQKPINDIFYLKVLPLKYLLISIFLSSIILVVSEIRKKIVKNKAKSII